jgi:dTDP-4-dehydrorhamnose 3,5-epimerase
MTVTETDLAGVLVFDVEPVADERGLFARTWDRGELVARGLTAEIAQVSVAFNEVVGTLRGLHFQADPHAEAKTVRCTAGAIFDVAVDLREKSATRHRWVGVELSAGNRRSLFVPEGCAHGYITLTDAAEVEYQISTPYRAEAARGYRWDDPAFAIGWPVPISRISDRDAALPFVGGDAQPM